MPHRMPAIFFGHGNPMNALLHNAYTESWAAIGTTIPRPRAVLAISAHWYKHGLRTYRSCSSGIARSPTAP